MESKDGAAADLTCGRNNGEDAAPLVRKLRLLISPFHLCGRWILFWSPFLRTKTRRFLTPRRSPRVLRCSGDTAVHSGEERTPNLKNTLDLLKHRIMINMINYQSWNLKLEPPSSYSARQAGAGIPRPCQTETSIPLVPRFSAQI